MRKTILTMQSRLFLFSLHRKSVRFRVITSSTLQMRQPRLRKFQIRRDVVELGFQTSQSECRANMVYQKD